MFGLGIGEILVILVIAILCFGDKNLPEHLKKLMKVFYQSKKAAKDMQNSLYEVQDDIMKSVDLSEELKTIETKIVHKNDEEKKKTTHDEKREEPLVPYPSYLSSLAKDQLNEQISLQDKILHDEKDTGDSHEKNNHKENSRFSQNKNTDS